MVVMGEETLTGGVVIERRRLLLAAVVVPEQSLVVAVLVPVEGLDLQASAFRVAAHDPGHSLVHGAGRRRGVVGQEDDLVPQVDPAFHTGQLDTHRAQVRHRHRLHSSSQVWQQVALLAKLQAMNHSVQNKQMTSDFREKPLTVTSAPRPVHHSQKALELSSTFTTNSGEQLITAETEPQHQEALGQCYCNRPSERK